MIATRKTSSGSTSLTSVSTPSSLRTTKFVLPRPSKQARSPLPNKKLATQRLSPQQSVVNFARPSVKAKSLSVHSCSQTFVSLSPSQRSTKHLVFHFSTSFKKATSALCTQLKSSTGVKVSSSPPMQHGGSVRQSRAVSQIPVAPFASRSTRATHLLVCRRLAHASSSSLDDLQLLPSCQKKLRCLKTRSPKHCVSLLNHCRCQNLFVKMAMLSWATSLKTALQSHHSKLLQLHCCQKRFSVCLHHLMNASVRFFVCVSVLMAAVKVAPWKRSANTSISHVSAFARSKLVR